MQKSTDRVSNQTKRTAINNAHNVDRFLAFDFLCGVSNRTSWLLAAWNRIFGLPLLRPIANIRSIGIQPADV